jgi:acyl carrier protein
MSKTMGPSGSENDGTAQAVRDAIAEHAGVEPHEVTLQTEIGDDLGVDGDDAVELFEMIADRFKVDLAGMHFERHFGPEGLCPIEAAKEMFVPWGQYPITVQDVVESVRAGRFIYDYDTRRFTSRRPWPFWLLTLVVASPFAIVALAALSRS